MKSKVARLLDTVDFDKGKKTELVNDVTRYLSSNRKAWYHKRGIPCRRGYFFHGPSGTGKSSLATALAAQFNTSLYILSLSDKNLDDFRLEELFNNLPARSILLLEDVDSAGIRCERHNDEHVMRAGVTLSGLLNALDGAPAPEGHVLIMSTSTPDSPVASLVRPGLVDLSVEFENATQDVAARIFKRMAQDDVDTEVDLETQAQEFAKHIPDRKFSPVEIQGYLLRYMDNMDEAAKNVDKWIGETIAKHGRAKETA